jgi:hypothetical protein
MNDRRRPLSAARPHHLLDSLNCSAAYGGTPLQRASRHLGDALRAAREDERADAVFVDLLVIVAAREKVRLLDRDQRLLDEELFDELGFGQFAALSRMVARDALELLEQVEGERSARLAFQARSRRLEALLLTRDRKEVAA